MQGNHSRTDPRPRLAKVLRGPLSAAFLFSVAINLLTLTGPIYMLQVYDRVLTTRSEVTLLALTGLVAGLYVCFGLLDHLRGSVLRRAAAQAQAAFDRDGFLRTVGSGSMQPVRAVDTLYRTLFGTAPTALFDAIWVPVFLGAIFLFHPWLGWFAWAGAVMVALLACGALIGQMHTTQTNPDARLQDLLRVGRDQLADTRNAAPLWLGERAVFLHDQLRSGQWRGLFRSGGRATRMFLQSAILGLGALLVLRDGLSPGAMVAVSILLGRALSPIEQLIAAIPQMGEGIRAAKALRSWSPVPETPGTPRRLAGQVEPLRIQNLVLCPPGSTRAVLRDISFTLSPGQALGVIGNSGSGKTALVRAVAGHWPPVSGTVTLSPATRLGYMPQSIRFLDVSLARNIAGCASCRDEELASALSQAGAGEIAGRLPQGLETTLGPHPPLSLGESQRLALARALFAAPNLLVLDEPDSHLDASGLASLQLAIASAKARKGAILIASQRPATLQLCDLLLHLDRGHCRAFGPRDEVLRALGQDTRWSAQSGAA